MMEATAPDGPEAHALAVAPRALEAVPEERWADDGIVELTAASLPAASSARVYRRDVLAFVSDLYALTGKAPTTATVDDLLAWWNATRHADGQGRILKPATVNRKVVAVRRFYREGALRDYFRKDLGAALPSLRTSKEPTGRALTVEEARALVAAAPEDGTLLDFRDRCLLAFLLLTGCRESEVCTVTVADLLVDDGRRVVRLHRKGGKETVDRVPGPLGVLLDAWLQRAGVNEGPIFRAIVRAEAGELVRPGRLNRKTVWRIVAGRAAVAGLGKGVGPHDLRRTYVTAATELDANFPRVARAAGHSDPATTMRYAHQRDFLRDNPSDRVAAWLWEGR